jgi:hypothetical protein
VEYEPITSESYSKIVNADDIKELIESINIL